MKTKQKAPEQQWVKEGTKVNSKNIVKQMKMETQYTKT